MGKKPTDNLFYWSNEQKLDLLKEYPDYRIEDDYVYAYKGVRHNRSSDYKRGHYYEVGQTYEENADHNLNENYAVFAKYL